VLGFRRAAAKFDGVKVALVFKRYADSGGSERQVALLARQLAARGEQVHVFCAAARALPPPGVTLHVMPVPAPGRTLAMLAFSGWARRAIARHEARHGRFDVRHAFGRTVGQDVYRLGGGVHRTYLEQAHALDQPAWLRPWLARLPYQVLKARIEERALEPSPTRRILVNSSMTRDDLVFRYGLARESIRVVPNGTDLQRFRPPTPSERTGDRARLGLQPDAQAVLFLGTGYARKGLDPTLRAVALLAARHPRLRLLVAGADSRPAAWRRLAARLGLADRVSWLGARPDPERLLRAADVLVLPTAYDPAANATVEALASGVPVITSASNGASEILQPGLHGTVVPAPVHPGDVAAALEAWLARAGDPAVAAACRARAEEFPDTDSCTAILEIYRDVVAARAAAPGVSS
jgi:UDP-glucose:(heptosyl)LPS alpha-1,3-glucosyltransferase